MRFVLRRGQERRDKATGWLSTLSLFSTRATGWRKTSAGAVVVAVRLVALASALSLLIRMWHGNHSNVQTNQYQLLTLPTTSHVRTSEPPIQLLAPASQSTRVGVETRNRPPGSPQAGNSSPSESVLEGLSSVDYVACCGLGHRLTKMSDAYLVSRRLGLGFRAFWGYCADDDDAGRGPGGATSNNAEPPVEVFHYLFGSQPKDELGRFVASNALTSRHGNFTYDHYLRLSNQVKNFAYLRRYGPIPDRSCPCTEERVESDKSFYMGLRERFRFRTAVDEFRKLHFGHTDPSNRDGPPVLGMHIRAGNGEQGDFAARGRAVADLDSWLSSVTALLRGRPEWHASTLFVATDTPRVIPRLQALLKLNTRIKVVWFEQSRPEEGAGVLFGEQRQVDRSGGQRCLQGWVDVVSDMILLSHADVVIAARPSSFTQAMPLSLLFETSSRNEPEKEFCEVNRNATELRCYRSVMDWCCNGTTLFSLDGISQKYDYISVPTTNTSHPDTYKGFQRRTVPNDPSMFHGAQRCSPRGLRHRQDCVPYDWSVFYQDSQQPSSALEEK